MNRLAADYFACSTAISNHPAETKSSQQCQKNKNTWLYIAKLDVILQSVKNTTSHQAYEIITQILFAICDSTARRHDLVVLWMGQ